MSKEKTCSFFSSLYIKNVQTCRWHPSTMMSFCCGEVLANTISVWFLRMSSIWSWDRSFRSVPWITQALASLNGHVKTLMWALLSFLCLCVNVPYLGLTWLTGMLRRAAMSSTVSLPSEMIPTPLAMALAVIGWSPVTIMTFKNNRNDFLLAATD